MVQLFCFVGLFFLFHPKKPKYARSSVISTIKYRESVVSKASIEGPFSGPSAWHLPFLASVARTAHGLVKLSKMVKA